MVAVQVVPLTDKLEIIGIEDIRLVPVITRFVPPRLYADSIFTEFIVGVGSAKVPLCENDSFLNIGKNAPDINFLLRNFLR